MARWWVTAANVWYGIAVGALTGALWAAVDVVSSLYYAVGVPWAFPVWVLGAYVAVGVVAGSGAGLVASMIAGRMKTADRRRTEQLVRDLCLWGCGTAVLGVCLLRVATLEVTAGTVLLAAGAGLVLASRGGRWSSERVYPWQVLCLAMVTVFWHPVYELHGPPWVGAHTYGGLPLAARSAAFVLGLLAVYGAGYWLLRHVAWLARVQTGRQCLLRAAGTAALVLVVAYGELSTRGQAFIDEPHRRPSDPAASERPNVILVSLDTVRADHLSLHGYHRPTSPNLAALAAEGVWFKQAISTASWTLPSHASWFTGLMPSEHGARFINGEEGLDVGDETIEDFRRVNRLAYPLSEQNTTLAELLSAHDYATAAVISNNCALNHCWQLCQGFDYYDDRSEVSLRTFATRVPTPAALVLRRVQQWAGHVTNGSLRTAPEINRDVIAWLDRDPPEPFFLFINYIDAHGPYTPHPEYDLGPLLPDDPAVASPNRQVPPEYRQLADDYDSELAYLDDHLGRLLAAFKRRGLYDDSLLIVVSDHGEAFGEHGWKTHGRSLYHEEVWVPMVVRYPGGTRRGVVERPTSTLAVFDTVLDEVGVENPVDPAARWRSLAAERGGAGDNAVTPEVLAELWPRYTLDGKSHPGGVMCAVMTPEGMKAIRNADERVEVYELPADPFERRDLSGQTPVAFDWAAGWLDRWATQMQVVRPEHDTQIVVDDALAEKLRSLGYLD